MEQAIFFKYYSCWWAQLISEWHCHNGVGKARAVNFRMNVFPFSPSGWNNGSGNVIHKLWSILNLFCGFSNLNFCINAATLITKILRIVRYISGAKSRLSRAMQILSLGSNDCVKIWKTFSDIFGNILVDVLPKRMQGCRDTSKKINIL